MVATDSRSLARGLSGRAVSPAADDRLPAMVPIYLVTVTLPIFVQAGPVLLSTLRTLLLVMILPMLVRILTDPDRRLHAADILFPLHILWAMLALAVNNPDRLIEQTGSVGAEFLGGYLLGRVYVRTPGAFLRLCRMLVWIVVCMLPFAIFEAVTTRPIVAELLNRLPGLRSVANVYVGLPRLGLDRVQLTFAHPIHFGLFCSIAFPLCVVALGDIWSPLRRTVFGSLVALACFLALSSGALLAILLQFGLIAWSRLFAQFRLRWWLLVGLFGLAYVVIDLLSNRTPLKVFMSYATFSAETAYWRGLIFDYGMQNVWAHPLFGLGLNDWARPEWMFTSSVDNFWLLMAMRYGIPGFALVTLGYALALGKIMARDFSGDAVLTHIRRAWVFTFLGLSFTLCTVHVWTNIYSFVFFMFGAGMWLITARPGQGGEGAPAGAAPPAAQGPVYSRFPQLGAEPPAAASLQAAAGSAAPLRHARHGVQAVGEVPPDPTPRHHPAAADNPRR